MVHGIDYDKNPILMISVYAPKAIKKTMVAKSYATKRKDVDLYSSEKEMLQAFETLVKEYNPDFISGYNIKGFDIPYVISRCNQAGIDFNIGVDFSEVKEKRGKEGFEIEGIGVLDLYEFFRRIMRTSVDGSLSLGNVARTILRRDKVDVDLRDLSKKWKNINKYVDEFDNFIHYCITDSILVEELYDHFYSDMEEFSSMVNVGFEELFRLSFSEVVEFYLMKMAKDFKQVIPRRPENEQVAERKSRRLKGAFVFEPKAGYYKDVVVYDFRSLYPSIIESHNISEGMISKKKEAGAIPVPEREYYFKQKPRAFIPAVTESIIERRGRLKEMLKEAKDEDVKQHLAARIGTLKLIANSLYGYFAFYMARWYSFECASAVTAFGRHYIKNTIDFFTKQGFKVIYSDTDSIFILLEDRKLKDVVSTVDKYNSKLPGLMTLELEKDYTCGIFVETRDKQGAKKRYALLDHSGKMKITGLAYVRGDWSNVAREIQYNVLEILLKRE